LRRRLGPQPFFQSADHQSGRIFTRPLGKFFGQFVDPGIVDAHIHGGDLSGGNDTSGPEKPQPRPVSAGFQRFQHHVFVGVDADVAGDLHRFAGDLFGRHIKIDEGAGSSQGIGPARADADEAILGLDHIAGAGQDQRGLGIGHRHHGFETAQIAVGAPILGEFDASARQIARMLLQLGLQPLEESEGIGRGAGKAGQDIAFAEPPHLAGIGFHHGRAQGNLAVACDDDGSVLTDGQDSSGTPFLIGHSEEYRVGFGNMQPLGKIAYVDLRGHTPLELLFLFRKQAHILLDGALSLVGRGPGHVIAKATDHASKRWLEKSKNPYFEEISLIAEAMRRPGAYVLNTCLEWGCTSGAWASDKGPMLRRVLDWPFPRLGEFPVVAQFRGRLGDYFNVTWPGFCGVLQAMAPERFAAAINQAPRRKHAGGFVGAWMAGRFKTNASIALPPVHLLRRVFETARDYLSAKSMLTMTPLAVPAIFTLTGTRPGEGCVIERTEDAYAVRELSGGRVCASNQFHSPLKDSELGWKARPIDSAGRFAQAMTIPADGNDLSWFEAPIANVNSRLVLMANAATGVLKVMGTAGSQPVTQVFALPA